MKVQLVMNQDKEYAYRVRKLFHWEYICSTGGTFSPLAFSKYEIRTCCFSHSKDIADRALNKFKEIRFEVKKKLKVEVLKEFEII